MFRDKYFGGPTQAIDAVFVHDGGVYRCTLHHRSLRRQISMREADSRREPARPSRTGRQDHIVRINTVQLEQSRAQTRPALRLLPPIQHHIERFAVTR